MHAARALLTVKPLQTFTHWSMWPTYQPPDPLHRREATAQVRDFRKYILKKYTFLDRPAIVTGDQVFIGNALKTVKAMLETTK